MIAMMLITDPELIIADEPTSALDVRCACRCWACWMTWFSRAGWG